MAHVYDAVRLYVNYFQPSFKLVEKTRDGASVVKRYSPPATPCDRLMQHDTVSARLMAKLSEFRAGLDPVALLHTIREAQSALVCQGRREVSADHPPAGVTGVREMLPLQRFGPKELMRWLEQTRECNEEAKRFHTKRRSSLRASLNIRT